MLVLVLFKLIFRARIYRVKLTIWILWVLKVKLWGGWQVDEGFVSVIQSSFVKFVMFSCWVKDCEVGGERCEQNFETLKINNISKISYINEILFLEVNECGIFSKGFEMKRIFCNIHRVSLVWHDSWPSFPLDFLQSINIITVNLFNNYPWHLN